MTQSELARIDDLADLDLIEAGSLDTPEWLASIDAEVIPITLPKPAAEYLREAREAGEV